MTQLEKEIVRKLRYDQADGKLYWKVKERGVSFGKEAGNLNKSNGYRMVKVGKVKLLSHRVMFFLVENRWPKDQIDHIDRNKLNDVWTNLREVSAKENMRNRNDFKIVNWMGLNKKAEFSNGLLEIK